MELENKHFLSEDAMAQKVLQEFSLPFRPFKRLEPDEKAEVMAISISKMSEKMLKKSGNKNIKSILSSKGDFSRTKSYKDFLVIFKFIKDYKNQRFNNVKIPDFDTIENSVKLLEKEKQNFKKCFNSGNEIGQLTYATVVASLFSAISKLFFLGFEREEKSGKLVFNTSKLNNRENTDIKTLENILKAEKSGKLKDVLKFDSSFEYVSEGFSLRDIVNGSKKAGEFLYDADFKDIGTGAIKKIFGNKIGIAASVILTAPLVLLTIKEGYFLIIKKRSDFSEYLREASQLIQNGKDNNLSDKTRAKQEKMAEKLNKLADKIDIDDGVAEVQSRTESENIDKEIGKELESDFNISF